MAYVLHEGYLVDPLDLEDPELAEIEVQVLAWLRELLERSTRSESPICG